LKDINLNVLSKVLRQAVSLMLARRLAATCMRQNGEMYPNEV